MNRYYYKLAGSEYLILDKCRNGLEKLGEKIIAKTGTLYDAQLIVSLLNNNTVSECI